jgi:hypothetical protein
MWKASALKTGLPLGTPLGRRAQIDRVMVDDPLFWADAAIALSRARLAGIARPRGTGMRLRGAVVAVEAPKHERVQLAAALLDARRARCAFPTPLRRGRVPAPRTTR